MHAGGTTRWRSDAAAAGVAGCRLSFGGPSAAGEMMGYLERSSTAWRPVMWPIKVVLCVGFFLMLLQILAELCKDIERLRGERLEGESA